VGVVERCGGGEEVKMEVLAEATQVLELLLDATPGDKSESLYWIRVSLY